MKLIKPYFEIIEQGDDLFKHIELCSRTCYKSEDKITDDSAKDFVQMLINNGHTAMLEHATVYLKLAGNILWDKYTRNPFSKINYFDYAYFEDRYYITTNYRVLLENNWLDDLKYICQPTEHHQKRISVRFVCDRGVSHELVRHRVFSFAQESTRYCNYSKDKFNNEITFIEPCWLDKSLQSCSDFKEALNIAEQGYFELLKQGWQPQQARAVIPNALKTEIVMTGFLSDWQGKIHVYKTDDKTYNQVRPWSPEVEKMVRDQYRVKDNLSFQLSGFFPLRTALSAHPQMRELAIPLYEMFKEKFKI